MVCLCLSFAYQLKGTVATGLLDGGKNLCPLGLGSFRGKNKDKKEKKGHQGQSVPPLLPYFPGVC